MRDPVFGIRDPVFGKRDLVFGKRDLVSDRIANEISFSGNEMKRDRKRDLKRLAWTAGVCRFLMISFFLYRARGAGRGTDAGSEDSQ
mgnify:CR=1 FL=1